MTNTYVLSGVGSEFIVKHSSNILDPGKKYEAALLSLDTYNSIKNITKGKNNIIKYSNDNGVSWKVIELDTGSYELVTLNDEIQRTMTINGDYDEINSNFYISITPNTTISITLNTTKLTSIIHTDNPIYKVDFTI